MDATTTSELIQGKFELVGDVIVANLMPIALTLFAGILVYFWGKRFVKKHLHS